MVDAQEVVGVEGKKGLEEEEAVVDTCEAAFPLAVDTLAVEADVVAGTLEVVPP